MMQEIAYLQERYRRINQIREEYIEQKEQLFNALQQQMESIEEIWNQLFSDVENNQGENEILSQVENLKSTAKTLLNAQEEKQKAIEVAIERLHIEENDYIELENKVVKMKRKYDAIPKNRGQNFLSSFSQRGGYHIATGREPPGNFEEFRDPITPY